MTTRPPRRVHKTTHLSHLVIFNLPSSPTTSSSSPSSLTSTLLLLKPLISRSTNRDKNQKDTAFKPSKTMSRPVSNPTVESSSNRDRKEKQKENHPPTPKTESQSNPQTLALTLAHRPKTAPQITNNINASSANPGPATPSTREFPNTFTLPYRPWPPLNATCLHPDQEFFPELADGLFPEDLWMQNLLNEAGEQVRAAWEAGKSFCGVKEGPFVGCAWLG